MKNIFIALLIVAIAGGLTAVAMHYKHQVTQITKTLETERYSRLVAEEKVVNSVSKIKQLQEDLQENEKKISKVQDLLKEQKTLNNDLEGQFQKLSKSKEELEEQIQVLISQQAVAAAAAQAVEEVVQRIESQQKNEAVPPIN